MGAKAPLIHRICMMDMLEYHLSVMVMIISSSDTIPSPEHGGKRDESGETQHFAEYPFLPFKVVRHFGEYRLRHSVYHAGDEELSHAAPFIGLVVISYFLFAVELTQYHGEQVVVDVIEYIGNQ